MLSNLLIYFVSLIVFLFWLNVFLGGPQCAILLATLAVSADVCLGQHTVAYCLCTLHSGLLGCRYYGGFKGVIHACTQMYTLTHMQSCKHAQLCMPQNLMTTHVHVHTYVYMHMQIYIRFSIFSAMHTLYLWDQV